MTSHRITRRRALGLFTALALPTTLLLTGCPKSDSPAPDASAAPTSGQASPAANTTGKRLKIGLVTDVGGVDDKSFNQSAWEGLQKAKTDFGVDIKYTESRNNADYAANLARYADNKYDLVFAVGYLMQDAVKDAAKRYPSTKFALIDGDVPSDATNAVSYKFREEDGSFLAGALAGLTTKTKTVGFVGGTDSALIQKFEVGYAAGVKTTNPAAQVKVGYAGAFNDPQKGQELALAQMGAGADIIYQAAGKTGVGVIQAVKNKGAGFYAIGVDKDQDGDAPGRILTSMVKRVDVAVYDVCKQTSTGAFKPGTVVLGLKEDGVALSEMKYTKKDVPAETLKRIDTLKEQIISGKITVPSTRADLASFTPPKG